MEEEEEEPGGRGEKKKSHERQLPRGAIAAETTATREGSRLRSRQALRRKKAPQSPRGPLPPAHRLLTRLDVRSLATGAANRQLFFPRAFPLSNKGLETRPGSLRLVGLAVGPASFSLSLSLSSPQCVVTLRHSYILTGGYEAVTCPF